MEDYQKMAKIEGIQSMLAPIILQCMTMYGEEETFEAIWRCARLLNKDVKNPRDEGLDEKIHSKP